ncbi:MAG: acyl-CoA dehydrogenase family protein, partial [Steroidobacteraceae bacterium]
MNDSTVAVSATAAAPSLRGASLGDRSAAVAAVAARHAAEVDAAPRFPAEAFAAAKAQRLLGIFAPSDLGGESAAVHEVADVCYRLGQACSSTAMIYAMHQVKVACLVRHGRGSDAIERLLRRLSTEQLLLASSTTEGQRGGDVRSSEAPVEQRDGRIHLERKASVISYGAQADGIVTTARRAADAAASDQVLVAFLKDDYTLTRLQGWNTLGMRGTCSDGYTLKASGSPGQVLPEPYEVIHARTMVPFAHLLWGSVWAGIAAGAAARAQAFVRHASRQSAGQAPPGAPRLTQ